MKKLIVVCLTFFLLGTIVPAQAANITDEQFSEVIQIADRNIRLYYLLQNFGSNPTSSNKEFDGWAPESWNFNGEITPANQVPLLRYAWACYSFFDVDSDAWDKYQIAGKDSVEGVTFKVPENVMLEVMDNYLVCHNLSLDNLPFYDPTINSFLFNDLGGWGGPSLGDEFWSVTKTEQGNWLAQFDNGGLAAGPNGEYPELGKCSIEMTTDYRVVSFQLDVDVQSLQWEIAPKKTSYNTGEALDLGGATIKVKHKSGASWKVPVTADMVTGYNSSKTGKQTIRVNYYNKYLDFQIIVQTTTTTPSTRPPESSNPEKTTGRPTSHPTEPLPSETTTTAFPESESTSNESITALSESHIKTTVKTTESTQPNDIAPSDTDTDPGKDGGFPLWGIILTVGILIVGGGAVAVIILIMKGKLPFLKK